jgi:adenylate cyclase, class 2
MATEIEMKARCADPAGVESRMPARAVGLGEFLKEDLYFRGPPVEAVRLDFRLRLQADSWVCTWKDKTIKDGLEVNLEREFAVGDGEAFIGLMGRLGCAVFVRKTKQGKAWRLGELTIEVVHVHGLGWFVEIERLLDHDDASEEEVRTAAEDIRRTFGLLGLSGTDVEPRPYTHMLLDAGRGAS